MLTNGAKYSMKNRFKNLSKNTDLRKQVLSASAVIIVASFLGFAIENAWIAIKYGCFENRGMIFPFLFGYGVMIVAVYFLFGLPSNPLFFGRPIKNNLNKDFQYILCIMITICVGESLLGNTVELVSGYQWWDFSEVPLHIGEYTSIPTSIGFALIIYLFMKNAYTPIVEYANKLDNDNHSRIIIVLMVIIILDYIVSTIFMVRNGDVLRVWRLEFPRDNQILRFIFYFLEH
ncbi:MAG: hypothetical protein E7241_03365 [Lachnospiraceae bacterium]|jgi:uncharacterized membrane protein|nr:hypothetical protein [Lachnospiraceae bacterium]